MLAQLAPLGDPERLIGLAAIVVALALVYGADRAVAWVVRWVVGWPKNRRGDER